MKNIMGQKLWLVLKLPNGFSPLVAKSNRRFINQVKNYGWY